jgi:hypothetical protein
MEQCMKWLMQILQTVSIVTGVIVALISLIKDHKRRRYQTTVEIYNHTSEEMNELRNKIKNIFSNEKINPNDTRYKEDKELQFTIARLLSLFEQISVGINLKVLDLDVFMRIAGRSSISMYKRLELVIKKRREKGFPTAYMDFEILVNKMREKYEKQPKRYYQNHKEI